MDATTIDEKASRAVRHPTGIVVCVNGACLGRSIGNTRRSTTRTGATSNLEDERGLGRLLISNPMSSSELHHSSPGTYRNTRVTRVFDRHLQSFHAH